MHHKYKPEIVSGFFVALQKFVCPPTLQLFHLPDRDHAVGSFYVIYLNSHLLFQYRKDQSAWIMRHRKSANIHRTAPHGADLPGNI